MLYCRLIGSTKSKTIFVGLVINCRILKGGRAKKYFFVLVLHCMIIRDTKSKKSKKIWSSASKKLQKGKRQTEFFWFFKCLQNFYSGALDQK